MQMGRQIQRFKSLQFNALGHVMSWITGLLTLRNVAILAGVLGLAFATQSLRIKYKSNKIEKLQVELLSKSEQLKNTLAANKSNQLTILKLEEANRLWAFKHEINEVYSKAELESNAKSIADIRQKYDEIRQKMSKLGGCINFKHDPSLDELLKQTRGGQD